MAEANVTLPLDLVQPAHLPPAGRSLGGHQHRRAVLAGIAAGGVVAVAPPSAQPAPDPVLVLLQHSESLERQADVLAAFGDEDGADTLWYQAWRVGDEAIATAPATATGLIAQLRLLGDRLELGTRGEEDAADVRRIMRHAQLLAWRAVA
jgi:hypothetical protein